MGAVVRVLCAMLAVLCCARVVRACYRSEHVEMWGIAGNQSSYYEDYDGNAPSMLILMPSHDSKIEIFCTGRQVENLVIESRNTKQHAQCVNTTTLKITLNIPESKLYECKDITTNCYHYLLVMVKPVISVSSRNLLEKRLPTSLNFFVPINEDYEVACTSSPTVSLTLIRNGKQIETHNSNTTTIKSMKLRETDGVTIQYICEGNNDYYSRSTARVYVDRRPAAADFWCIEYSVQVNCTWTCTSSIYTTVSLLFLSEGHSTLLCVDHSSRNTKRCEWNHQDILERGLEMTEEISLQTETCNLFVCVNQSFHFNRNTIMKANPPVDLRILNKSSNSVTIAYSDVPLRYFGHYYYSTLDWSFSLRETRQNIRAILITYPSGCVYGVPQRVVAGFKLPCPGRLYEVKLRSKYMTTQNNQAYWSEPARITFSTDPAQNSSETVDPVCNMEPELITNKEAAIYAIKLLARDIQEDKSRCVKAMKNLSQKLALFEEASQLEL